MEPESRMGPNMLGEHIRSHWSGAGYVRRAYSVPFSDLSSCEIDGRICTHFGAVSLRVFVSRGCYGG